MIDLTQLRNELIAFERFADAKDFGGRVRAQKLQTYLTSVIDGDARDLDEKDEPASMDTLGSLIDKLITVDLKMWHNQEQLYAIRRMSVLDFTSRYENSLGELHDVVKRCCDLNVQRSRLMDAIDAKLEAVVKGTDTVVTAQAHKTY